MPTVLRKYGIRFHFYGADMDEPPHIHATGDGTAKVWLDGARLEHTRGFNQADQDRILQVVRDHHDEFLEAWNEFRQRVS